MWKLEYSAPRGLRTNRGFSGVVVLDDNVWYSYQHSKWLPYEDVGVEGFSTLHYKPKTTKAFKRYLKKHPELKPYKVVLVHRHYTVDKCGKFLYDLNITAHWEE